MQTFLPYPDYARSAACLDGLRLRKQIIEAYQIFRALTDSTYGWQDHPAVRMWSGCEHELLRYAMTCHHEYVWFRTHQPMRFGEERIPAWSVFLELRAGLPRQERAYPRRPHWFGNVQFHLAHQSNLIAKNIDYYQPIFGRTVPPLLEYVWPPYGQPPRAPIPTIRLFS